MEEIDIWTSVIQWAMNQVPGLENEPHCWSSEDFTTVRAIVSDCIHLIRFFNISTEDFREKIVPYNELLTKELYYDMVLYHTDKNYKPKSTVLLPRKGQAINDKNKTDEEDNISADIDDSIIINRQQAAWIAQKIMESIKRKSQKASGKSSCCYEFTLLYRSSRDGNTAEKFRQMCAGKGSTVVVGKILNTEEILGGYNPIAWKTTSETSSIVWALTSGSFIFSLDNDESENNMVSSVVNYEYAIQEARYYYPCFGSGDLFFGGKSLFRTYLPFARQDTYQIPIRSDSDEFHWADWEVFLVTKVN